MIHKVSNQNKRLLDDSGDKVTHGSMNKSAMDSFSNVVIASARALIAKGHDIKSVADKFKIKPEFLQSMLDVQPKQPKLACVCDEVKTAGRVAGELDESEQSALDAYNSLHNIKNKSAPTLPTNSSKRILSGKGSYINDMSGPQKQMGSERSNSIWDANVVARQSKQKSNDEIIREKNTKIAKQRAENKETSRYQTIDGQSVVDKLRETDQSKTAGVVSAPAQEAHKYNNKLPSNGMSIFDTSEFQRVPEKTAGEKRREEIKNIAAQPKDRSWVQNGAKSVTSNDIVSNFINSLLGENKKD